jgi:hypothetical protein
MISNTRWIGVIAKLGVPAALLCLITACTSYRAGSVMHPQITSIAIGEFANATDEPALAVQLRKKLAEQFMRDGSVRLDDSRHADVILVGTVRRYDISRAAAAKVRDEEDFPDDRSTYRTSIYNADVEVDFQLLVANQSRRLLIPSQTVTGSADFPEMPDLNITRQSGLQQALHDAAGQIVAAITEAW